jgi:hypothetical protein
MKKINICLLTFAIGLVPCRAMATTTLGTLTFTRVAPRILTPNGDRRNDIAFFEFNNPDELPITGTVYDLSGARVADLQTSPLLTGITNTDPTITDLLVWDGKSSDGQTVAGGIYIYQILFQGKTATGTVIVAR